MQANKITIFIDDSEWPKFTKSAYVLNNSFTNLTIYLDSLI